MGFSEFTVKPCKSRAAIEFVPKKRHGLRLEKTARRLEARGMLIEAETPFLLAVKTGGVQASIFKSGKIIVKTDDEEEAGKIAERIRKEAVENGD